MWYKNRRVLIIPSILYLAHSLSFITYIYTMPTDEIVSMTKYYDIWPIEGSNSFVLACTPQYAIPENRQYDYIVYRIYEMDYIHYEYGPNQIATKPESIQYADPILEITFGKYDFIKLHKKEQDMVEILMYMIQFCKNHYMTSRDWKKDRMSDPLPH